MADGQAVRQEGGIDEERLSPFLPAYLRHVDDEEQGEHSAYSGVVGARVIIVNASLYGGVHCGFERGPSEISSEGTGERLKAKRRGLS